MVAHPPRPSPPASAEARASAAEDVRRPMSSSPGNLEQDLPIRARFISPSLLMPAESVIFELKPSRWYILFVSLPVAAVGLAIVLLALAIQDLPLRVREWAQFIGVSIMGLRIGLGLLQWFSRTYVLTDRRIIMQAGLVDVAVESMGLEEVADVFVAMAAAQQALGIGTIFFRHRLGPPSRLAWEHVRQPHQIRARLIEEIERWRRRLEDASRGP
jgi:hypothetical protein